MNAINPITLPAQSGTSFTWSSGNFAALPSGFNLISTADSATPSQFNTNVSVTPPSPGTVPTNNFVSLWAWDAVQGKWYFYSPLLESSGGLPAVKAYADSHKEDVQKYYDEHLNDLYGEQIRVRHILRKVGDSVTDDDAKKEIDRLYKLVTKEGADFGQFGLEALEVERERIRVHRIGHAVSILKPEPFIVMIVTR